MICRRPQSADPSSFLVGWPSERRTAALGFHTSTAPAEPPTSRANLDDAVAYTGDSHYLCIAPTGAGKSRSIVISNLLSLPTNAVVIDIKGELYHVTAGARRRLGQQVIVLDPFGITQRPTDGLNPLDRFTLAKCDVESEAHTMADALSTGFEFTTDPFWNAMGTSLCGGLLAFLAQNAPVEERHLNRLVDYLFADDVVYGLAVLLDTHPEIRPMARRAIAATLQLPEKTRESVVATAQSYVAGLQSAGVQQALGRSTFDLVDVVEGRPLTIYICIPPDKLRGYASLLRLWVGTLLAVLCGREHQAERTTWFFIDECAQLGTWKQLEQVLTLMRGYGVQAATFWQDLSQLRNLYPLSWPTILNNSAVVQTFGITKWLQAKELSDVFGVRSDEVLGLASSQSLVMLDDGVPMVVDKLDYLRDPPFANRFGANPRFVRRSEAR